MNKLGYTYFTWPHKLKKDPDPASNPTYVNHHWRNENNSRYVNI